MSNSLLPRGFILGALLCLLSCSDDGGSDVGKRLPDPTLPPSALQQLPTISGSTVYAEASSPDGFCYLAIYEIYSDEIQSQEARLQEIFQEGRELELYAEVEDIEEDLSLRRRIVLAERRDCGLGVESVFAVKGYVEKGAMREGSPIRFERLNERASSTGDIREKTIKDNFGRFTGAVFTERGLVRITAEGQVWDEATGQWTAEDVELEALHELGEGDRLYNVNLLTHLIAGRIEYLLSVRGKDFGEAERKARREILEAFTEEVTVGEGESQRTVERSLFPVDFGKSYGSLRQFNVNGVSNEGDAFLVGFSALVMSYLNGPGRGEDVNSFLQSIASDFAADGDFDQTNLKALLEQQAANFDPVGVNNNLIELVLLNMDVPDSVDPDNADAVRAARFEAMREANIGIPTMDAALDLDLDGAINLVDADDDGDEVADFSDGGKYDPSSTDSENKPLNIRVNISGMNEGNTVVIADRFGIYDNKTLVTASFSANGVDRFSQVLPGSHYDLYVKIPPEGQRCFIGAGSGLLLAESTTVNVTCQDLPPQYWLQVKVSGLEGWLILDDGNGVELPVLSNGVHTFEHLRDEGSSYNVKILRHRPGDSFRPKECWVVDGPGVMLDNTVVRVNCNR